MLIGVQWAQRGDLSAGLLEFLRNYFSHGDKINRKFHCLILSTQVNNIDSNGRLKSVA